MQRASGDATRPPVISPATSSLRREKHLVISRSTEFTFARPAAQRACAAGILRRPVGFSCSHFKESGHVESF
ncbi:MAG: hypothetical protein D6725_05720 [Planctomycetota bacterium]|nr:MAG: hypothetical protein D6725_05720 [Planctomycetota bacterium]